MSGNKLQIVVSAVDKATAVVAQINKSFNKLTQPIEDIRSSIKAFSKEAGLDRVGKAFSDVGRSASDVAQKVGSIVAPMTAVVGTASVAGVVALATAWGNLGAQMTRSADAIGLSTGQLQRLQGSSALAGLGADAMTGSLKSLGATMEDAFYGRNQFALSTLLKLGIGLHKTASGAMDTDRAFNDLADGIAKFNGRPQVQSKIAQMFGIDEMLPLLQKGSKGIEAYKKKAVELGGVMSGEQIARADQFALSLRYLSLAGDGLRNSIGSTLIPVLQPLIEKLTSWVAANRDLIASRVSEMVEGLSEAINKVDWDGVIEGIKDFGKSVLKVVDFIGGWKVAAWGLVAIMNGALLGSILNLSAAIIKLGGVLMMTPFGRVVLGISLAIAGITAAGVFLYENWSRLAKWWHSLWGGMGDDAQDASKKIKSSASHFGILSADGGEDASPIKMLPRGAPVPSIYGASAQGAAGAGQGSAGSEGIKIDQSYDQATGPAQGSGGLSSGLGGKVQVEVTINSPQGGTRATVKSSGNVQASAPRINYTMPTTVTP